MNHENQTHFMVTVIIFALSCLFSSCAGRAVVKSEKRLGLHIMKDVSVHSPYQEATLKGIKSLFVCVAPFDPDTQKFGLDSGKLRRDTELKLALTGINTLSYEQWLNDERGAQLCININLIYNKIQHLFFYNIFLQLKQQAYVTSLPAVSCLPVTWDRGVMGVVVENHAARRISRHVSDLVDDFLNDYLSVNAKKQE